MMAGVAVEERIVPGWMRALELGAGLVAIALGFVAIAYQTIAILTLVFLLAWALVMIGIREIAMGAAARWRSGALRALSIVAGVASIILAVVVLAFPGLGFLTLVGLLYLGLVIFGVAQIGIGAGARFMRGWTRGFFVVVGVLDLILASLILLSPGLAELTLVLILSLALVVSGLELAVSGMVSRFRVVGAAGFVATTGRERIP